MKFETVMIWLENIDILKKITLNKVLRRFDKPHAGAPEDLNFESRYLFDNNLFLLGIVL